MHVLTEEETLEYLRDHSIARFGDGELRLAIGGSCSSQKADPALCAELVRILKKPQQNLVVGVPNFTRTPRRDVWDKYRRPPYLGLFKQETYGSAFITRPDSAPWIDRPWYWDMVRGIWRDRDVVLVHGDEKSLTASTLADARSVREVHGPRQHAYAEVDRIAEDIGQPTGPVLMCLGATATVLAARLAAKGIHALDLGHMGMFMRHAGAYQFTPEDLASRDYRRQLQQKHGSMKWGRSGDSHAPEVIPFLRKLGGRSVLDYGCGRATLAPALPGVKVFEYDPGIKGKDALPKPADLVVCTDVLEHIEPDLLDHVLRHILLLASKGAYLVIATRPARELLPDGRNAHLIVQPEAWWVDKLKEHGWASIRTESRKGLCVWLEK